LLLLLTSVPKDSLTQTVKKKHIDTEYEGRCMMSTCSGDGGSNDSTNIFARRRPAKEKSLVVDGITQSEVTTMILSH
jgi:hypothetical protein